VKTRVDDRLRRESARFAFRFACDDCAHAHGEGTGLRCSLGYPAVPRLGALGEDEVLLCKTFELV
jgi:hypothetical protein